ncbi:hypothetical protein SAMN05444920_10190 [Nonomuraea solani]|uniref:WD40-like Beta Propeller Repeat n=1 Tax=Nonomuraea solani TaxID=1144553 RepID=A0A1H5T442_9ACTN|nr:hypothetical protein [Nonomuraea solani]SEF56797.1 hypothetical protein SAMN05444920_10190 [Nonomuraea solani]
MTWATGLRALVSLVLTFGFLAPGQSMAAAQAKGPTLRYMGLGTCGGQACGPWKAWLSDDRVIQLKDARATVRRPGDKTAFAAPMGSIISFTPDGSRALLHTDGHGDEVVVYDLPTSTVVRRTGPAHALAADGDTLATRIEDGGTWITFTSLSRGTEVRPRVSVLTSGVHLTWNRSGTLTMLLAVHKGPWRNYRGYDRWVFDPRTGKTRKADRIVIPRGLRAHRIAGFS